MTTKTPSQRRSRRSEIRQNVSAIANAEVMENSHMLPHGTRPTASPRNSTPTPSRIVPSHVVDIPMLPARRPGGRAPSSGPPTATSVRVATATAPASASDVEVAVEVAGVRSRPRRDANDSANAIIATVYAAIAPYTR